ncbi:hypothetical protein EYM_03635 [Ignicoccus islandicus DSM 13165]|uniref:Uncharacterized protein n=1 Tax=Ignicoccus islandicus DSM 13165 TaxID=940295 RepID=A0A0U3G265_9CREN|nr:hypothetical protein [Ignicoccus islandicus]ALU12428.1 hypothetical protein EYM_03635 [Ignicoccus islandicus DSM 13165]
MPKYPDFLRQVFNVVIAEHQNEIGSRLASDLRRMVWTAESKFKFNSFEVEDPREGLKKYFETEFAEVLKLLKPYKNVVEDLIEKVEEYYGKELAEILREKYKKIVSKEN